MNKFTQEIVRKSKIQKSIEESKRHYQERKKKAQEKKEYLKAGVAKLRKVDPRIYKIEFTNGFKVAIGIIKVSCSMIQFTCAICSPKDNWSNYIAKGLIGHRLEKGSFCLLEYDCSIVELAMNYIIDRANGTSEEQKSIPGMSRRFVNSFIYGKDVSIEHITQIR